MGLLEASESKEAATASILGIDSSELVVLALAALGESGTWGWEGRWELGRMVATRPGTGSSTLALSTLALAGVTAL